MDMDGSLNLLAELLPGGSDLIHLQITTIMNFIVEDLLDNGNKMKENAVNVEMRMIWLYQGPMSMEENMVKESLLESTIQVQTSLSKLSWPQVIWGKCQIRTFIQ